jgi:hypothetical protein
MAATMLRIAAADKTTIFNRIFSKSRPRIKNPRLININEILFSFFIIA